MIAIKCDVKSTGFSIERFMGVGSYVNSIAFGIFREENEGFGNFEVDMNMHLSLSQCLFCTTSESLNHSKCSYMVI